MSECTCDLLHTASCCPTHDERKARRVSVTRIYDIACAHRLPSLPEAHKCHRLHGHNYRIELTITGKVDASGMLLEAAALDTIVRPVLARLDHQTLNELPLSTPAGQALVANPTVEQLALYLFDALRLLAYSCPPRTLTHRVRCWENERLCAEVGP